MAVKNETLSFLPLLRSWKFVKYLLCGLFKNLLLSQFQETVKRKLLPSIDPTVMR